MSSNPHCCQDAIGRHSVVSRPTRDRLALSRHRGVPGGGFTLMELMVVISLITILITMGTLASLKAFNSAAEQQTRILLAKAKGIAEAYESATAVVVNQDGNSPIDWSSDKPYNEIQPWTAGSHPVTDPWRYYKKIDANHNEPNSGSLSDTTSEYYSIERFVWATMRHPTTMKLLRTLGEDFFVDDNGNGFMDLVDGWGRPVKYCASNDPNGSNNPPTIRDSTLPIYGYPFFASPGEDGRWGDYTAASGTAAKEETEDNLNSFDLDQKYKEPS